MCIVFMICECSIPSLRIWSSKSLSARDCAETGRQSSVEIKTRASVRRCFMKFSENLRCSRSYGLYDPAREFVGRGQCGPDARDPGYRQAAKKTPRSPGIDS